MDPKQELKAHLGIREWLYYESSRYDMTQPGSVYHPILRRVDAVTGRRERLSFDGSWHQSNMEYSREYVRCIYGR